MQTHQRQYPLFSACGLNCGLCPRYHASGASKCPGCAGDGFFAKHPSCGILSCSWRNGVEYCCLCDEYPCKKYDGADLSDSFITHKNQLRDLEKMKRIGLDAYKAELDEKVEILRWLLDNYNDGRQKGFLCIAVNLLDLQDIKYVAEQIKSEIKPDVTVKEKSAAAAILFQTMEDKRDVSLKLRKR